MKLLVLLHEVNRFIIRANDSACIGFSSIDRTFNNHRPTSVVKTTAVTHSSKTALNWFHSMTFNENGNIISAI